MHRWWLGMSEPCTSAAAVGVGEVGVRMARDAAPGVVRPVHDVAAPG